MRANGHKRPRSRVPGVIVITRSQAEDRLKSLVGATSRAQALAVLKSGKMRGTAKEAQIESFLFLLGEAV